MTISPIGVANEIQSVLAKLLSQQSKAVGDLGAGGASASLPLAQRELASNTGVPVQYFSVLMKNALQEIDASQKASSELGQRFIKGDPQVALSDVMIASQKASINLQTAVQVRNRFVSAYQNIMNMQV